MSPYTGMQPALVPYTTAITTLNNKVPTDGQRGKRSPFGPVFSADESLFPMSLLLSLAANPGACSQCSFGTSSRCTAGAPLHSIGPLKGVASNGSGGTERRPTGTAPWSNRLHQCSPTPCEEDGASGHNVVPQTPREFRPPLRDETPLSPRTP